MQSASSDKQPPLWIWGGLFVVLAGIACSLYLKQQRSEQQARSSLESYVKKGNSPEQNNQLVLVFGTSQIGWGLDSCSLLQKCIDIANPGSVRVLKIWKHSESLSTFNEIKPVLEKLKPSVIVIEGNMLFYRFPKDAMITKYLQVFRNFFAGKQLDLNYDPDKIFFLRDRTLQEVEGGRAGLIDTTDLESFRTIASGWQKKGCKILVMNFPIEYTLEENKWRSPDTIAFYRNMQYFRQACPFEYVDPGFRLSSAYFIDHAHMNRLGRQKQTSFFCRTVAAQIKRR
jgi:hypothetical protein